MSLGQQRAASGICADALFTTESTAAQVFARTGSASVLEAVEQGPILMAHEAMREIYGIMVSAFAKWRFEPAARMAVLGAPLATNRCTPPREPCRSDSA
jgi:hypothetical protein